MLLPILFNFILEKKVRETNSNNRRFLANSNINLLAYSDNIKKLGDTEEAVKPTCGKLITIAGKVGLDIINKKMKVNAGRIEPDVLWRVTMEDRDGWREICLALWFQ